MHGPTPLVPPAILSCSLSTLPSHTPVKAAGRAMHFLNLPIELRYQILEVAVAALSVPLGPPDVEQLHPKDWSLVEGATAITPPIRSFRTRPWTARILPLLLINKPFRHDTTYVWEHYIGPKLPAIANVDCVGAGTVHPRPLTGVFIKWLSLPSPIGRIHTMQVHIRFFDHRRFTGRASLGENRVLLPAVPRVVPYFLSWGLKGILGKLCDKSSYPLNHQDARDISQLRALDLILRTDSSPDLHWSHRSDLAFQDANSALDVSLHPYMTARNLATHYIRNRIMRHLPLRIARWNVYVDDDLVFKVMRAGDGEGSDELRWEQYEYDVPIDPLFLP
ncbi:hypothetical protein BU26DRAFT_28153 [Trematosphaeria pertusa]|uniref:Uncharacterized protein n=1 Tax=Trematosphaeria pertusa TaxID=390896 RepID=A0A6A6J2U8_9PLEO|nr:uncharacterized protein BU26DRAFT_28153 [Trematosphaeria pertusa]KAF2256711.1 hypothetical protein BU26DRAFT_28153 [Trematosphaeria pertusa]